MNVNAMVDHADMSSESWHRLFQAAADPSHPMRLFTLATVNAHSQPDARILVLRGANRELDCLWFHTDQRSAKIEQLLLYPHACAVAYAPLEGIQLRIRGDIRVRIDDEVAERHWQQTEMAARYAYAISPGPGAPLSHPDPRMREHRASLTTINEHEMGRENFAVLELRVESIEWLQVGESGDRRAIMHADEGYEPSLLVP